MKGFIIIRGYCLFAAGISIGTFQHQADDTYRLNLNPGLGTLAAKPGPGQLPLYIDAPVAEWTPALKTAPEMALGFRTLVAAQTRLSKGATKARTAGS